MNSEPVLILNFNNGNSAVAHMWRTIAIPDNPI